MLTYIFYVVCYFLLEFGVPALSFLFVTPIFSFLTRRGTGPRPAPLLHISSIRILEKSLFFRKTWNLAPFAERKRYQQKRERGDNINNKKNVNLKIKKCQFIKVSTFQFDLRNTFKKNYLLLLLTAKKYEKER